MKNMNVLDIMAIVEKDIFEKKNLSRPISTTEELEKYFDEIIYGKR